MIRLIQLANWRTHKATKLEFNKGTNVLVGPMGAGKSSVMDAISFALFGTFPAIKHRRNNLAGIIMNRPSQEKEASVKIAFSVDNDDYEVERKIPRTGSAKATITKNGEYLQSQPERVTEEIEKILKMDYDLFSRAIYSEQNRLDYFLELKAKERKEQIDRLLGLDKFANAEGNTTSFVNKVKDMISGEESALETIDVPKLKQQSKEAEQELHKINEQNSKIKEKVATLESTSKKLSGELTKLKEELNKKTLLTKDIADERSKSDLISKEISTIDSKKLGTLQDLEEKSKSTSEEVKRHKSLLLGAETKLKSANELYAKIKAEMSQLEQKATERTKLLSSLSGNKPTDIAKEIEEIEKLRREIEQETAKQTSQKQEAQKWIQELTTHLTKCPVCERDLSDEMVQKLKVGKQEVIDSSSKKVTELKEKTASLTNDIKAKRILEGKLKLAEEKLKSTENVEKDLADAKNSFSKQGHEVKQLYAEKEALQSKMEKLNEQNNALSLALSDLRRRKTYKSELEQHAKIIQQKEELLNKISVDENAIDVLQKQITAQKEELSAQKAYLESNLEHVKDKENTITQMHESLSRAEQLSKRVVDRRKTLQELNKFKKALSETQSFMRTRLIGAINETMDKIWPELYPYGDYKRIKLDASNGDYALRVMTDLEDSDNWEDVDAIASGGERSTACLAMRVAFALVLVPNLRWLILDEPTHNIDKNGIDRFIQVFNDTLPGIIEQIFIITHDEVLKQAANSKVYSLSRDKTANGPTMAAVA